jgi:hypothetical protein
MTGQTTFEESTAILSNIGSNQPEKRIIAKMFKDYTRSKSQKSVIYSMEFL